MPKGIWN